MKTGKSLSDLAAEIERQAKTKVDYTAPTKLISMTDDSRLDLRLKDGNRSFGVNKLAHEQIAERLKIPRPYYERMRTSASHLLARNVNHWFENEPEKRLLRTLDGNVRAFLSNRYRTIDNFDLAEAVLPIFQTLRLNIESCELTERRLYLKAIFPDVTAKIPRVGDTVAAGVIIANSEVGCGLIDVSPFSKVLDCTNGATHLSVLKRRHVGRGHQGDDDFVAELFSDATRKADDRAFMMKIADVVKATVNRDVFGKLVATFSKAVEERIEGDVQEAVEVVASKFDMNETEKGGVLRHLIEKGDLSRYGMFNAVTRMSADVEDYDRASEFERAGGKILELPKSEWKTIATATA